MTTPASSAPFADSPAAEHTRVDPESAISDSADLATAVKALEANSKNRKR